MRVSAKHTVVTKIRLSIVLLAVALCAAAPARAQDDGVQLLLNRVERIVRDGDTAAYFTLLGAGADRTRAREFAGSELMPGVSRSALQERDRAALAGTPAGGGYRLMVDVMA